MSSLKNTCCRAFAIVSMLVMPQMVAARDVKGKKVDAPVSTSQQRPLLIETTDSFIHYDPALRLLRIEREDGSELFGTIDEDDKALLAARFRLTGGELLSISIAHQDSESLNYTITTSLDNDEGRSIRTVIPEETMQWMESDSLVFFDGEVIGKQSPRYVIVIIGGILACFGNIAACNSDVLQDQDFCHNSCGSQGCNDCCGGLATGDMKNCGRTCGLNGPDGDYGNCTGL